MGESVNLNRWLAVTGQHIFAAHQAQVVNNWQEVARVVTLVSLDTFQVGWDLENRLHQDFLRALNVINRLIHQALCKKLHLLGNLSGPLQLHHPQSAVHLVNGRQTRTHAAAVRRILRDSLKRVLCLLEGRANLVLNPV